MGNDQAEEADRADDRGGDGGQQNRDERNDQATAIHSHAERARGLVFKGEQVAALHDGERE